MLQRRYPRGSPLGPGIVRLQFHGDPPSSQNDAGRRRPFPILRATHQRSSYNRPLPANHGQRQPSIRVHTQCFPCHTTQCPGHPPKGITTSRPHPAMGIVNIPTLLPYSKAHHCKGPINTNTWSSTSTFATARHCHWYSIHPGLATIPAALAMHSTLGTSA